LPNFFFGWLTSYCEGVYLDNNTAAANHLSGFSFFVNLAQSCPFTKFLAIINLDQVDLMFSTQSFNKLHICSLITILSQDTKMGLSPEIKSLVGEIGCLKVTIQVGK
jgi:hypothetical protein